MPEIRKLQIEIFLRAPAQLEPERVVPVFHSFIREGTLPDELLIDVASYGHVHHGPAVVLVGHAVNYVLDTSGGRVGLVIFRKRDGSPDPVELVRDAFRRLLRAARQLELAPELAGVAFRTDELLVRIPDRLHAPNSPSTFDATKAAIEEALRPALGSALALCQEGTEKEPFTVRVRTTVDATVDQLLGRS